MDTANTLDLANAQNTAGVSPATPKTHHQAGGERMYHIVAIVERTGKKIYMTAYPATHKEACTMLSKITVRPSRRVQLEQI